jgi:hypothetical protein
MKMEPGQKPTRFGHNSKPKNSSIQITLEFGFWDLELGFSPSFPSNFGGFWRSLEPVFWAKPDGLSRFLRIFASQSPRVLSIFADFCGFL